MAKRKASRVQVEAAVLFLLALGLAVPGLMLARGRAPGAPPPADTATGDDAAASAGAFVPLSGGSWTVAVDMEQAGRLMGLFFDTLSALKAGAEPPAAEGVGGADAPVFVSVYAPGGGFYREQARAGGPGLSVREAAVKLFKEVGAQLDPQALRVRIDLVRSVRLLTAPERLAIAERGLGEPLGFAVQAAAGGMRFYLAPDIVDYHAETTADALGALCLRSGLQPGQWRQSDVPVWAVRTVGFVNDTGGSRRVLPSERGLASSVLVNVATLMRAERLAGDYLSAVRAEDGSFCTLWDVLSNLRGGCESLTEQASASAALCELGGTNFGSSYLSAGYAAVSFAMHYTDLDPKDPTMAFTTRQETCQQLLQTEASARVLEALCRFHSAGKLAESLPWIQAVSQFLLHMQRDDGRFELVYDPATRGKSTPLSVQDAVAPHAAAALALALASRELGRDELLQAAQKALDGIAASCEPAQRAWTAPEAAALMDAILAVNSAAPQERNLLLAGQVAACRRKAQLSEADAPAPDLAGASADTWPPSSTAASADLDTFAAACLLGPELKAQNEAAAELSARYLLRLQFLPENSYYLPTADSGAGGFRELPGSNIVRLQAVDGALRGLIKLTQVKRTENERHS
jgi:hypothetical protein